MAWFTRDKKLRSDVKSDKPSMLRSQSNVRMLDGQAVLIVQSHDDGNVTVVYEDDRTNSRWLVCADWLK